MSSAIVLSSEDEEDCFIVKSEEQVIVQPPHTVFIRESKFAINLLKEDDLEETEEQVIEGISTNECHKEPENISPGEISSPSSQDMFNEESFLDLIGSTCLPNINHQNLYHKDSNNLNDLQHEKIVKDDTESNENSKQDNNNLIFQRLAAALTTALLPSLNTTSDKCFDDRRNIDSNFKDEMEDEESVSKKFGKSQLDQVTNTKNSEKCDIKCDKGKYIQEIDVEQVKKRGKIPGRRKGLEREPGSKTTQKSNFNSATNGQIHSNETIGVIQLKDNSCSQKPLNPNEVGDGNSTASIPQEKAIKKKKHVKEDMTNTFSENIVGKDKKRGRPLGWRKANALISKTNKLPSPDKLKPNKIKKCRKKPNCKAITKSNNNNNNNGNHEQVHFNETNITIKTEDQANLDKTVSQNDLNYGNERYDSPVEQEEISQYQSIKIENEADSFTMEKGLKAFALAQNKSDEFIPEAACNSPHTASSTQYPKMNYKEHVQKEVASTIKHLNISNLPEPKSSQTFESNLASSTNHNLANIEKDFIGCYNKIFDNNFENLIMRLGDILLLAMKELKLYTQIKNTYKRDSCPFTLNTKTVASMFNFKDYSSSFSNGFHEIFEHILSCKEMAFQHKALLLALFIKIFLRVVTLSPEFIDSIILAKHSISGLLRDYLLKLPDLKRSLLQNTLWQKDMDFERNCWVIIKFCVNSLEDKRKYSVNEVAESAQLEAINSNLKGKFEPNLGVGCRSAQVSVIVNNHKHQENQILRNQLINNTYTTPITTNNNRTNFAPKQVQEKIMNHNNNFNSTYLSKNKQKEMQEKSKQTYHHVPLYLGSVQNFPKETNTANNVGVKRKAIELEDSLEDEIIKNKNQSQENPVNISPQDILSHTQVENTTRFHHSHQGVGQNNLHQSDSYANYKLVHITKPNIQFKEGLPPPYYSVGVRNSTSANSVSGKQCSVSQFTNPVPHGSIPVTHACPQNPMQFKQSSEYCSSERSMNSSPTVKGHDIEQRTNYTAVSTDQPNTYSKKPNPLLNSLLYKYLSHSSPHHKGSLQSQNQPHEPAYPIASQSPQHTDTLTTPYGYNSYYGDPRSHISSVRFEAEKSSESGTNIVLENNSPHRHTHPQQIQNIRSSSDITVNNYNINLYNPPIAEDLSQNSDLNLHLSGRHNNMSIPAAKGYTSQRPVHKARTLSAYTPPITESEVRVSQVNSTPQVPGSSNGTHFPPTTQYTNQTLNSSPQYGSSTNEKSTNEYLSQSVNSVSQYAGFTHYSSGSTCNSYHDPRRIQYFNQKVSSVPQYTGSTLNSNLPTTDPK